MFLAIIYLKRSRFVFNFHHTSFRIHKDKLKLLLKVGIPSSAQNVIVGISFLVLTSIINDLGGVTASAAVGIVGKFNSFAILPAIAMSASVSAMSAQNIGAGLYDRAQKTLWSAITISFAISVAIFAFVQIFPEAILQAFKAEPDVIDIGVSYLRSFSYDYLIVPFAFCFNGLLNGSGYSIVSMTSSIVSSLVFRIPLVFLFARVLETGVGSLGYAAPIATVFASLIGGYFYFSGKWKKDKLKIKRS
jgi:Na+-driven multidrug efflux pump